MHRSIWRFLLPLLFLLSTSALAEAPQRVVVLGGALTEIAYALGAGDRLVGADQSSIYPPAAHTLPKVGYYRQFSVEGVVALRPDLILASEQAGPPEAINQLRRLGKRVVVLPADASLAALEQRIYGVAGALQLRNDGRALVARLQRDVAALQKQPASKARTLLLIQRGRQAEGAGLDTAAHGTLQLAGLSNVLAGQKGYKPLSLESIAALRPELIVTSTLSLQAAGGIDALLAQPGIAQTPAAKQRRVIVLDDLLLLGFGPRLPEAIAQLRKPLGKAS
ncbi:heme/hemin ABC transporter substrate-binding protein [Chitinilyticum litopenaei]|uniref:heme/hemin ABC transporter substrate-binding protein n=1 Tax=Chitinilyticum litopenaei TaxID=1121276 RepID=UPI0003FFE736|nr:ABC transporter substrate-binding protein [Chitinilyticum litopenaei]